MLALKGLVPTLALLLLTLCGLKLLLLEFIIVTFAQHNELISLLGRLLDLLLSLLVLNLEHAHAIA